jgi:hypothetical protein
MEPMTLAEVGLVLVQVSKAHRSRLHSACAMTYGECINSGCIAGRPSIELAWAGPSKVSLQRDGFPQKIEIDATCFERCDADNSIDSRKHFWGRRGYEQYRNVPVCPAEQNIRQGGLLRL